MGRLQVLVCLFVLFLTFSSYSRSESIDVPVIGASKAKVTIVVYTDFQCPHCAQGHATLKELFKQYKGQIKIAFKHYPLNTIHPWAEDAASASVCAFQQDSKAFWKIADYFFQKQSGITAENLSTKIKEFSTRSNLNYSQLQTCMQGPSTKEKIASDTAEAERLGVSGVPAFSVNGKILQGAIPIEEFKRVIDQALTEAQ